MSTVQCAALHRSSRMAVQKLIYPAADRNKDPVLSALREHIRTGPNQSFLEIASGTGQHIAHFAPNFPQITFYPSEYDARLLDSISAHINGLTNVRTPLQIDITTDFSTWGPAGTFAENTFHYIYCANMIHISPFQCTVGLFENVGKLMRKNGILFTYGPYAMDGVITPESNVRFDKSLKSQDPEWGLRDVKDLEVLAQKNGIGLKKIVDMPANNKVIVWEKL